MIMAKPVTLLAIGLGALAMTGVFAGFARTGSAAGEPPPGEPQAARLAPEPEFAPAHAARSASEPEPAAERPPAVAPEQEPEPERPAPILAGTEELVAVRPAESVLGVAQKHGVSPDGLRRLNSLRRWRVKEERNLLVSSRAIAPRPFEDGIVVNVPAFRLFLLNGGEIKDSWPVALGKDFDRAWKNKARWRTPLGTFKIRGKFWQPDWYVPKDLQEKLKTPREVVPYGDPEYPLGIAKLQLTARGITIHGTNSPYSIGRTASHGCIRMWNPAIAELYKHAERGMQVAIVYAPVQVVEDGGRVWLEVSRDVYGLSGDLEERARMLIDGAGLGDRVDPELVERTVQAALGIPIDVTLTAPVSVREAWLLPTGVSVLNPMHSLLPQAVP